MLWFRSGWGKPLANLLNQPPINLNLANQLLLEALVDPKTEDELGDLLRVTKPQIKQWLKEVINQGLVCKITKQSVM